MSELQSTEKSLNIIKDEIYGSLREIESNMKIKFIDLESKIKKNLDEFNLRLNSVSIDSKELKEIIFPQKLQIEKISDLLNFKNKVNDMLITHEVRIKNNFDTLTKFQLRYDKIISDNLYVPGYIGTACQYKTLSDYLSYNISEVSKIKLDREQMRKDFKDLKTRQENMMKSIVTLNQSSVQICKTYADGKNKDIKQVLNEAIEGLNQKSFDMRTMVFQFVENAKKLETKLKVELENIIQIKNNIANEIKKANEEITKKIKEHNYDINITKKRMENITEQIKEANKNINNIKLRYMNSNDSILNNNKSKINISSSVSPFIERRLKQGIKINLSPKTEDNNLNKNINKTDISLESILTENSDLNNDNNDNNDNTNNNNNNNNNNNDNNNINNNNDNYNNNNNNKIKNKRDMEMNTNNENNENNELKEIKNNIKENKEYKTIENIKIKPKINNDYSLNNTKMNSINENMKIQSIENMKNKIKNNENNIVFNKNKGNILPSIIKKKGTNLILEETRKSIENIYISPRTRTKTIIQNNSNDILKIKNTNIVFHLDNNNNDDSFEDFNSIRKAKRKKYIEKKNNNKIIKNKNINNNIKKSMNKININNNKNINDNKIIINDNNSNINNNNDNINNAKINDNNTNIDNTNITNNNTNNNTNINKSINTNINNNIINNNIINNNNLIIHNKKVKFTQKNEIIEKKESDKLIIKEKEKEKEKKVLNIVSLTLPIEENENKKNKNTKEELSNIMDTFRVNAFTNMKNENNIDLNNDEEILDFPRKVKSFGRTTYNFFTKSDILNHINANKNINNFDITNNKNKK